MKMMPLGIGLQAFFFSDFHSIPLLMLNLALPCATALLFRFSISEPLAMSLRGVRPPSLTDSSLSTNLSHTPRAPNCWKPILDYRISDCLAPVGKSTPSISALSKDFAYRSLSSRLSIFASITLSSIGQARLPLPLSQQSPSDV